MNPAATPTAAAVETRLVHPRKRLRNLRPAIFFPPSAVSFKPTKKRPIPPRNPAILIHMAHFLLRISPGTDAIVRPKKGWSVPSVFQCCFSSLNWQQDVSKTRQSRDCCLHRSCCMAFLSSADRIGTGPGQARPLEEVYVIIIIKINHKNAARQTACPMGRFGISIRGSSQVLATL